MDPEKKKAIYQKAEEQYGLLTRAQALKGGMRNADIQRHIKRGHWTGMGRGVYRISGAPQTYEHSVKAATLLVPGSVAYRRSAARLLSLPIDKSEQVEVAAPTHHRPLEGVAIRRGITFPSVDRSRLNGIPLTSVSRTVIDLAGVLDAQVAAKVLDHVLARRLATLHYIAGRLTALGTDDVGRQLMATLVAERQGLKHHPDSWYQARLVEIVRGIGLQGWEPEHEVVLPSGKRRRIDLAVVRIGLGMEVVSYLYHSQLVEWSEDQARNNELVAEGWWMLYLTTHDIEYDPDGVGKRILGAADRLSGLLVRPPASPFVSPC